LTAPASAAQFAARDSMNFAKFYTAQRAPVAYASYFMYARGSGGCAEDLCRANAVRDSP
jgi:hypothetical protein